MEQVTITISIHITILIKTKKNTCINDKNTVEFPNLSTLMDSYLKLNPV